MVIGKYRVMGFNDMYVRVDGGRAFELGRFLALIAGGVDVDYYLDPDLYPPVSASRRDVVSFFLVMVAMDHRLSRPGRPYEGFVDNRFYHGADLLYKLGCKRFNEDPGFFGAERLARVTVRDVVEWLSVKVNGRIVKPPDPEVRAELLRDIGLKLLKLYDGDPYNIVVEAGGYLKSDGGGFINILKVFKAYQDPVEKKAYLLAKFLERRGVLQIVDHYNKEVPVDNHLVRIAIRTGIVEVDEETLEAIASGIEFDEVKDVMLRLAVREAYKKVARYGGLDPFILDDILWNFGRKCCTRENPTCRSSCRVECLKLKGCNGGCILAQTCKAYSNPKLMIPEHKFTRTYWY